MKTIMVKLLQDICEGLRKQGYKEHGGSDVYRVLSKGDIKSTAISVKVFMKPNYENPTHIVVRYG